MVSITGSVSSPARRWRLLRRIVVIVVVLALGSAVVIDIGYDRVGPLVRGSTGSRVHPCVATSSTQCTTLPGPGVAFWFAQSVINRGALPVAVDGLSWSFDRDARSSLVLDGIRMDSASDKGGVDEGSAIPFAPFTLAPGEERLLFVDLHVRECATPMVEGDMSGMTALTVRYHLLLVGHEADVRLGAPVLVPYDWCDATVATLGAGA